MRVRKTLQRVHVFVVDVRNIIIAEVTMFHINLKWDVFGVYIFLGILNRVKRLCRFLGA